MASSRQGVWGESNWRDKEALNATVVMYDYADDLFDLERKLREVRPNLLLIGAMTLALPGAVEIARMAKELLGDDVTVVLGGKHTSETIYREHSHVRNNPGSPLRLMSEGKIPHNFDVVVSGDGEYVVVKLGELVAKYATA
ncbi:MAG: B12-binding domain/radical SAM domain-containing protein, partial [Patescibacteria group bacterium]